MSDAEFLPLRPRRRSADGVPPTPEYQAHTQDLMSESLGAPDCSEMQSHDEAQAHDAEVIPAQVAAPPLDDEAPSAEPARQESATQGPCLHVYTSAWDDDEERAAAVREDAIRFAAIATARALRVALAADAGALTRYVDDALQACGRVARPRVRLHPADAASYRPRSDVDIVADPSSARGEVIVETEVGAVHATIENRAALLARAAAHA